MHGNWRSDLEDLAFLNRSSREVDEIDRRVCLSMAESICKRVIKPGYKV